VVTETSKDFSVFIFKGSNGEETLLVGLSNLEDEHTTIL
jgi:hypothetical protein